MNNNRLTASKSKAALEEQSYDLIQQHIIDPENSPLPEHLRVQCNRVLQIARLLDDYPNESHIINIMLAKYRISRTQIRKDIALAKELFKTQHQFDWDFWYAWMIKDQIQLIRHRIPDIDPGKSQSEDQRTPEYPDQDPAKRFFFHHGSFLLVCFCQQYRRGDHPVAIRNTDQTGETAYLMHCIY